MVSGIKTGKWMVCRLRASNINDSARFRGSRFHNKNGEILSKTEISIKNGEKNGKSISKTGNWKEVMMRRKNIKDRCEKKHFSKCLEVCKTYDAVQTAYAKLLQEREDITEFRCNVPFEAKEGDELDRYTSDFVCIKNDGEIMVRECLWRKNITRPKSARLLDASKNYWLERGVTDWGLVIDEEK